MTTDTPTPPAVPSLAERLEHAIAALKREERTWWPIQVDAIDASIAAVRRVLAEAPEPAGIPTAALNAQVREEANTIAEAIARAVVKSEFNRMEAADLIASVFGPLIEYAVYRAVARLEAERDAALAEVKRLACDRIEITDGARAGT